MAYVEYNPALFSYFWRNTDESTYIPFSNESPDYYLVYGKRYYSESKLKRLKFTAKEIKALSPDLTAPNPRYPNKGNMRLYLVSKVNNLYPI